jgi:hypothetical protein
MRFESLILTWFQNRESAPASFLLIGFFCGILITGALFALIVHLYSMRMFRWRILDEVRRELRDPLTAYVDWLHAVSAEFSIWKAGLLPGFAAHNAHDQYELNRLRRLFVDPRGQSWFSRLEEYEPVLGRFRKSAKDLWLRQAQIHEQFQRIFHLLDQNPRAASEAGHWLENLAFEQSQSVSQFVYHMQYECLKSVADSRSKVLKQRAKPQPVVVSATPTQAQIAELTGNAVTAARDSTYMQNNLPVL